MKTIQEIKSNIKNDIADIKVQIIHLEDIIKAINESGINKSKNIGDKTANAINELLNSKNKYGDIINTRWINVNKPYEWNKEKTCSVRYKKEKYDNKNICEFYDAISSLGDIEKECVLYIEYLKKRINEIESELLNISKYMKMYGKVKELIKSCNGISYDIRSKILEGEFKGDYRINL